MRSALQERYLSSILSSTTIFNRYLEVNKATMHFEHKVAEKIEVDRCGTTVPVVNELTGEVTKGYLFVGTLPYSQYSYAELMGDMKQGLSDILKMEMSYLIRPTRKWVTITMSPSFLLP